MPQGACCGRCSRPWGPATAARSSVREAAAPATLAAHWAETPAAEPSLPPDRSVSVVAPRLPGCVPAGRTWRVPVGRALPVAARWAAHHAGDQAAIRRSVWPAGPGSARQRPRDPRRGPRRTHCSARGGRRPPPSRPANPRLRTSPRRRHGAARAGQSPSGSSHRVHPQPATVCQRCQPPPPPPRAGRVGRLDS